MRHMPDSCDGCKYEGCAKRTDQRGKQKTRVHGALQIQSSKAQLRELSPKVGDGGNRKGGISWGCLTPPLLHQRSDMPCPKITSSSCFSQETSRSNSPISC